jgi:hypothetical protein
VGKGRAGDAKEDEGAENHMTEPSKEFKAFDDLVGRVISVALRMLR